MNTIHLIMFLLAIFTATGFSQERNSNKLKEKSSLPSKDIMLLGVYHFDNPGMDTYNLKIDDYYTHKRQEEIREVVDLLATFKPNKIFVEFLPSQQAKLDSLLTLYLNDNLSLKEINGGQNEVYQLGFRLAKKLNLKKISAIDHQGVYLAPYADFIADTLSIKSYQDYDIAYKEDMEKRQQRFTKNTVRENLIYLNDWQQVLDNHNYYNNVVITVKDTVDVMFSYQEIEEEINGMSYLMRSFDFNNIGVELVSEWYKRNLFIYRNILGQTEDNDKVLVIFGSGHLRYLTQLLEDNPEYNIVSANEFLKNKK